MNSKRFLPLLILILVSIIVFAGALGLVYILSVDAKTPAEKVQSMLTLGIPSGIALLVLFWLGAGIDRLLSRIKQKSMRVGVSLVTYIVGPIVLCVGLPALVGFLIYTFMNTPGSWKPFSAPPEAAVEFVSANGTSVVIRTASDTQLYSVIGSQEWTPVAEVDPLFINHGTEASAPPSFDPPDGTVQLRGIASMNMGVEERTYYAIVDDGSVWYLQEGKSTYGAGFLTGMFLTIAILPAIAGLLVIYLGAGVSAVSRWMAG